MEIRTFNIHNLLFKLAKKAKYSNLFSIAKELNGFRLFKNDNDFTKPQEIFINYLYSFDVVSKDIVNHNISQIVINSESSVYFESYMIWKRKNGQTLGNEKQNIKKDLHL